MLERTRSLACKNKKHASKSPQVRRNTRPSLRNGFNGLLRALPGDRAFLPPSPVRCASIVTKLTSASRCQDHTTSPSAPAPIVSRHYRVHRIPHPTFVTIAKRPSGEGGTALALLLFLPKRKAKYFSPGGWTGKSLICPSGKSVAAREPWRMRSRGKYSSSKILFVLRAVAPCSTSGSFCTRFKINILPDVLGANGGIPYPNWRRR
jgi:hypothetical protein